MAMVLSKMRNRFTSIGIDLGHSAARAVQLTQNDEGYSLVRASRVSMPDQESAEKDSDKLAHDFTRLLSTIPYQGHAVTIGVGAPDAELHTLELPSQILRSSPEQLEQAVFLELDRVLQNPTDNMEQAWWQLPRAFNDQQGIIGVAIPADRIKKLWNACRATGYACHHVDALPCAAARFGELFLNPENSRTVWGVLDIGHVGSRLILCLEGTPVLVRNLTVSSLDWTRKIAQALQVSNDSAEVEKCECGITLTQIENDTPTHAHQGPVGSMIAHIIQQDLNVLSTRIERSFSYILQAYRGVSAGEIVLIGAGGQLKNLNNYLQDRLGIPVHRADTFLPTSRIRDERGPGSSHIPLGELASAIGLAIEPEEKT